MNKSKKTIQLIGILVIMFIGYTTFSQMLYKNDGISKSEGKVSKGSLTNAYKIPYSGDNYSFFSPFSYYILRRSYVNSKVHKTIIDSYKQCETDCPGIKFRVMECSNKKGGKAFPHKTHQNGLSVDFMTPLVKNGKQYKFYDRIRIWRYLMNFDSKGNANINENIKIDFDAMAKHIINLDKSARKNGLKIKIVIFKLNLKDDLYKSKYGKKLKRRGIYFARHLSKKIDMLHDDHYHIDFEVLK